MLLIQSITNVVTSHCSLTTVLFGLRNLTEGTRGLRKMTLPMSESSFPGMASFGMEVDCVTRPAAFFL